MCKSEFGRIIYYFVFCLQALRTRLLDPKRVNEQRVKPKETRGHENNVNIAIRIIVFLL